MSRWKRAARFDGAITARSITVFGGSMGKLVARDIVRVLEGATVRGDVAAPRFELEEGAVFKGRVERGRTEAAMRVAAYRQHGAGAARFDVLELCVFALPNAGVAQLVEQLIRNQQVLGSSPSAGSRNP